MSLIVFTIAATPVGVGYLLSQYMRDTTTKSSFEPTPSTIPNIATYTAYRPRTSGQQLPFDADEEGPEVNVHAKLKQYYVYPNADVSHLDLYKQIQGVLTKYSVWVLSEPTTTSRRPGQLAHVGRDHNDGWAVYLPSGTKSIIQSLEQLPGVGYVYEEVLLTDFTH